MSVSPADLELLTSKIKSARLVLVITGAGVSAESGIATFRGKGGYWEKYKAEELASPDGFRRNPELVWRWYQERQAMLLKNTPNPGHQAIAQLEAMVPEFQLVTQNVDGYHSQAGSKNVIEIHGNIWEVKCTQELDPLWQDRSQVSPLPKHCDCGALARPNVLWFGESYDQILLYKAMSAMKKADVVLIAGTSGMVWIVSSLLQEVKPSAWVVDINIAEQSAFEDEIDQFFSCPSGTLFPQIITDLEKGI